MVVSSWCTKIKGLLLVELGDADESFFSKIPRVKTTCMGNIQCNRRSYDLVGFLLTPAYQHDFVRIGDTRAKDNGYHLELGTSRNLVL